MVDDVDILEDRPVDVDSDDLLLIVDLEDVEVVLPRRDIELDNGERITVLPISPSNYEFLSTVTINQVFLPLPPTLSWTEHFSRASFIFVIVDLLVCIEYWLRRD